MDDRISAGPEELHPHRPVPFCTDRAHMTSNTRQDPYFFALWILLSLESGCCFLLTACCRLLIRVLLDWRLRLDQKAEHNPSSKLDSPVPWQLLSFTFTQ